MKVEFGYGKGIQTVDVPDRNLIAVLKANEIAHERRVCKFVDNSFNSLYSGESRCIFRILLDLFFAVNLSALLNCNFNLKRYFFISVMICAVHLH